MKVLIYAPLFWPDTGGIEIISAQLMAALSTRGHEFVIVTAHGRLALPEQMDYQAMPVYRFPMIEALTSKNLRQILTIQREIAAIKQAFQPDLIHLHLGGPTPLAYFQLQTAQIAPAPMLVTVHNCFTNFDARTDTVLGQCLRSATWITAGSETMCTDLRRVVPELASRTSTLRCALPLPAMMPTPLDFAAPRLLYLGRLVPEKGVDLALAAFQQLADTYPRLVFWIAGEGPARPVLETQVQQWGLANRVRFTGHQPWQQISALFNAATLVLMPSRWHEPFGLVALEAAQMARPVVATQVGGLPEIILHQQTGLLVAPENPAALAAGIVELLTYPAQTQQMGQAARHHALTHFAWGNYVDAYDQLYTKLN